MKAEDMPTPRIDRVIGASYRTLGEAGRALQREAEAVERDLAVQTALVELAVELLQEGISMLHACAHIVRTEKLPGTADQILKECSQLESFLAEIGARSAEAIQERK